MCIFLNSLTAPPRKLLQHPTIWAANDIEALTAAGSLDIDGLVQDTVQMQLTCNQILH